VARRGGGEEMGASGFGGKIEGTRSLGRLRHGLEDNIKVDSTNQFPTRCNT
jgi:hypothetical protein